MNLAFSSIPEEARGSVIARCYTPLLDLAEAHGPIGIEATGYTLEDIAARDPAWIARLRALIAAGRVEFIGSGHVQLIGPLVPARVAAANLRFGHETYERLLGVRPTLALVNEQAYSAGVAAHYLDAGYRAILMDWDNPAAHHPEWDADWRYGPQRALCADGRGIDLLWTNTVAFQKLQRLAHGDCDLDAYTGFIEKQAAAGRTLCLYASDAEIFDFRPGRFRTEEAQTGSEWTRIAGAFTALKTRGLARMIAPSAALDASAPARAPQPLRLETASCPVPVKKQRKYNITRWAVTGRDDLAVNAACQRVYAALCAGGTDANWKTLCTLWSSDFRTHITEARWADFCRDLAAMEQRLGTAPPQQAPALLGAAVTERFLTIETPCLRARLDRRRGMAIAAFAPRDGIARVGGLEHGYFDDIGLQADWYTGNCVLETPGEPKITDLEWAEARVSPDGAGGTIVSARIATQGGPVEKTMHFRADAARVDVDVVFHWKDWGKGSLRLGHVTLMPDAFDWERLHLTTHNGGHAPERFALAGQNFDHGAPVSALVSASHGFAMTEGWAELGDGTRGVRVHVDRTVAPLIGLLAHRPSGGSLFCQIALSAMELDDTRKPSVYGERAGAPRRARFSIEVR